MKEKYSSKNLDHLGIVSQICDEIGIVEVIDKLIPPDSQMKISHGECIKLMVINGLGFTSRPLYLEAQFFSSRPVHRFLRKDCEDAINDDRLRRTLDRMFAFGCDPLFASVASQAALRFGISKKFRHLDSTSMQVHGEYEDEEGFQLITFGYSKDHRPDLKQFMIYLMSSQDGDVPLLAKTVAGNTSDKKLFRERLKEINKQIQEGENTYFIADSALYTRETLTSISSSMKWMTRVPENLVEAKGIIQEANVLEELEPGYTGKEYRSEYANVKQRWLLVRSEQAYLREAKTLKKWIQKEKDRAVRELKQWSHTDFDCEKDAKTALSRWEKKLKYHMLEETTITSTRVKQGRGRPKADAPAAYRYRITGILKEDSAKVDIVLRTKGRFIIATNELDESRLKTQELLQNYKGQQSVERGFRFLKEPAFMTSSVFLKSQKRIIALAVVMCLCLLVYTIAQRYLRNRLAQTRASVPNQLGKPTRMPTMRWIFQLFEGVHLLIHRAQLG
ncbi:MAG: IS1634 family transposase, partial [Chlamydiia bacterium]|nr:IS1634 family transposase [Chlamydiia bacterium]